MFEKVFQHPAFFRGFRLDMQAALPKEQAHAFILAHIMILLQGLAQMVDQAAGRKNNGK